MWLRTHIICCILFLGIFSSYTYAQETKEDIEKEAEKYFKNDAFLKATPLFLRLLSLEPRNPNYNYKYGTCLLYNSSEKKKAFRYLNFAVSNSKEVEDEAYYYLGKAYHLTYQFNKAIENYQRYKSIAGSGALEKLQVDRQIQMCKNGKTLLANISETVVLNKQEIGIEGFFRIYDLNNIGGELIVTEDFQSRQDKKKNHTPLIHFPANSDRIFYSTYVNDNEHKNIVMRTRLPDGGWSLEQSVLGEVNTNFDEDYPYMHPSGNYLYFSSKGHNSMGGYDVFRSPYDKETNTFGKPENLDIAISSPDNDFLYIVDSLNKYAYFASQRESELDKVNVYHVRVERFPIQIVIIKGQFSSTLNPSTTDLSIIVNDASGVEMGRYETDEKGGYLINLPRGGKYEFVLKVDGKEATFKHWIELPYLKEFRPLKQKITETEQDGNEIVLIENQFDEEFDDPMAILAEVLGEKSKMNVNKDDFDLDSLDHLREQRKLLAKVGLEKFSNYEIKGLVDSKFEDLNTRLNTSKEKIAKSKKVIYNGTKTIENSLKKADSLMSLANNTTNNEDKERFIRLANQELQKVKYTEEKVKNAIVLLDFLEEDLTKTEDLFNQSKSLKEDLNKVDTDDDQVLLEVLSKHKSFVENELKEKTTLDPQFEFLSRIEGELKKLEEQEIRKKQLEQQKIQAQKDIERLKQEVSNAKKRDKEVLEMELNAKENELSDINNEIDYTGKLIQKGEGLRDQKQIVEEVNNTTVNENQNFDSTSDLKNQFSEQSNKIQTQTQENKEAIDENNINISEDTNESNNPNTNNITEVSESEKQEILDEVDNNYAEEITQIEDDYKNGDASIDEVIDRKMEHRNALNQALEDVNEAISENGTTPQNTKRKQVIEQELSSVQNEIALLQQNNNATVDPNENNEVTETNKQTILEEVDNNYAEEISQIENDYKNGDASIDEVIDRKKEHRNTLDEALEKVQEDLAENGSTPENTKRKQVIEQELSNTNNQIAELEQIKNVTTDTNDITAVSENEKQEILDEVDNNYSEEITQIENDYKNGDASIDKVIDRKTEHHDALKKALDEVNEDINKNGSSSEDNKRKQVIEQEISNTDNQIAELEQIKNATTDSNNITEVSESEKQEILEAVDKNYLKEITQIEDDYKNGDTSIDEVIDRKKEHRNTLDEALEKVQEDLAENGSTPENTKRKQVIEQELSNTNNQIAELQQIKSATTDTNNLTDVSESEKQAIIDNVDKSYRFEIGDLSEDYVNNRISADKIIKRQEKYIDKIENELEIIEKALSQNENVEENSKRKSVLNDEKRRVSIEIDELEQASKVNNENIAENKSQAIQEAELNEKENEALNSNESDIKTLKLKEKGLKKVERTLKETISNTTSIVEKRNLNSTLEEIKKETRRVQIEIGDLSQGEKEDIIANNNEKINNNLDEKQQSNIKKSKAKIDDYTSEKEGLEKSIAESDSPADAEKSQKELEKIEEKIAKEKTKILKETTETGNNVAEEEVNKLQLEEETSLTVIEAKKDLLESKELIRRAENTKDPVKKADLLKEAQEKQNNAIEKSEREQTQRKAKILIGDISSSKELNTIDPENVSKTETDIEEEQIQIGIKLMEIEDQLSQIDALMPSLKGKDADVLNDQKEELIVIQEKLKDKQSANAKRLNQIAQDKKETKNKGVDETAIDNELSYQEEVDIAQTKEYKEISRAVNTLEQKQYELKVKEEKLVVEKTKLKEQLESIESKENPSQQKQDNIAETLTNINKINNEITVLKNEIKEQQENINIRLPNDPEKREQIENMIARSVDPIIKAPILPTLTTGIVLLDENKKTYSDENPIPLTTEKPEGLVFRVQIGAFSKPVPNETFNDFSPVTGEEVRPGLIRYMAGYFGGRSDATLARNRIRTMGYNDAFVVAYCDGERIPVYRAEQLLASGACVPTIATSGKPILTAEEAPDQAGGTTFEKELDEFAYNKAPGAAEADVAESKMGLYYTVQVGVYNTPVSAEQLKNISPLITKRLPNGQMRYSSGVFDNLDDARKKQKEAIDRGITDAFIVAYFKGERITVSQAQKLLEENGPGIFESKNPTVVKRNKVESKPNTPDPEPEKYFANKSIQVQFVSYTTYDTFPTQILQRYNNADVFFYFDTYSGKIKSVLYNQKSQPKLNELAEGFKEIYFYKGYPIKDLEAMSQEEAFNKNDTINQLIATVLSNDLNDDLIQTILNSHLLKQIETTERGLKAVFYEKNSEEGINTLQIKLARYGATRLKKSVVNIQKDK